MRWSGQDMQSDVVVAQHLEHGAPQIVSLQGSLGVKAHHECSQVAAILLQLPPAIHFHQWEELHASGMQRMVGRMGRRIVTAPHKLPCTNTERRDVFTTHGTQTRKVSKQPKIKRAGRIAAHPTCSPETRTHVPQSSNNTHSRIVCNPASNPPL